ncbi:hypothetical protein CTAYLR_002498 [Chrysophaeum taylorii]|uniref:F-box domain-containing protein n=1 Tax=Chrysophaeum taylorii TaxID=2483200 RepID=A0AAD7UF13_9STRA|nr:hypothetical protein CTAYLR_002498 [Chrysophaeum taylorii]
MPHVRRLVERRVVVRRPGRLRLRIEWSTDKKQGVVVRLVKREAPSCRVATSVLAMMWEGVFESVRQRLRLFVRQVRSKPPVKTLATTAGMEGCLSALPDDVLLRALARLPLECHRTARCVCRKMREVLTSRAYRTERVSSGCAETLVVVAGGQSERLRCSERVGVCRLTTGCGLSRETVARLPAGRRACSALAGDVVVVLGGFFADGIPTATGVSFSPTTTRTLPFPAMRIPRAGHATARLGGSVVAAGGLTRTALGSGVCASVERFDGQNWSFVEPLPRATCFCAAGVLVAKDGTDHLILAGGEDGRDILACVQAFDGARWSSRAPLPLPLCATASAVYRNKLYVFGGWSDRRFAMDLVLVYDYDQDSWSLGPTLPARTSFASACATPDGIILVSGDAVILLSGRRGRETITALGECEILAQAALALSVL